MLIGENKLGELIDLSQKKKTEIRELKKEKWICPSCKEGIIIKNGDIMCSHFSHKQNSTCSFFSENESKEHLLGKKLLAENCQKYGIEYKIEAFLPELNQRPDILIDKKYAIEFQCSSLSVARFEERTINYQKNGYHVIWVLGKNLQIKKKISSLQQKFIYLSSQIGFYLWEMDVETKTMRSNYLLTLTPQKLLKKKRNWSLLAVSILNILAFPKQVKNINYHEIETELNFFNQIGYWNHRLNQKQEKEMKLQAYFYQKGLNIREFPCKYFLPSYQSVILKEKELILRYSIYDFLQKEKQVHKDDLYKLVFQELEKMGNVKYPLVGQKRLIMYHLSLYLCFLEQSGIVRKEKGSYLFQKKGLSVSQIEKEILGISLKYVMINK